MFRRQGFSAALTPLLSPLRGPLERGTRVAGALPHLLHLGGDVSAVGITIIEPRLTQLLT